MLACVLTPLTLNIQILALVYLFKLKTCSEYFDVDCVVVDVFFSLSCMLNVFH